jgi:hypothetical protein
VTELKLDKPGKQIDLLSRALESAMANTDTARVSRLSHDLDYRTNLQFMYM